MLFQQIINGLTIGSTYALVAIGFTLVFGVLQLTNFANGSLYMLGAYLTLVVYLSFNGYFILSLFISMLLTGFVGYLIDRFALRTLRKKNAPKLSGLITTLGMSMVIENSLMVFLGGESKKFPSIKMEPIEIGNTIISGTQILILIVAFVLMSMLTIVIYKTKLGKAMRSISQNADAAQLMGININLIISLTFVLSGFLAAIAGSMVGMHYQSLKANMGQMIGMKTFASAILGGVGVLPGAVVGGLTLGIIEALAAGYISAGYRDAISFLVLIIVLLFRPTGFFGKKQITKV